MSNEITLGGRRLSPTAICKQARIKPKTLADVLSGNNPNVYACYAVFHVFRSALVKGGKSHLLPDIYQRLDRALTEDYSARLRLLLK